MSAFPDLARISVAKYSFFMTHLTKAVVLADYTLGALMTGALFFQSAGSDTSLQQTPQTIFEM
eukprot:2624772-Amphidinium_carterae.1